MGKIANMAKGGYTIVELFVTIAIVAVLTATVGVFIVKLLGIEEREREDAYVREKLADVCAIIADYMSIGSVFCMSNGCVSVDYRWETGGVSLETGLVTRVARIESSVHPTNRTVNIDISGFVQNELVRKHSCVANGNAELIPLAGDITRFTLVPLNSNIWEENGVQSSDGALGFLEVEARYRAKDDNGGYVWKSATAGRMVRLWNWR